MRPVYLHGGWQRWRNYEWQNYSYIVGLQRYYLRKVDAPGINNLLDGTAWLTEEKIAWLPTGTVFAWVSGININGKHHHITVKHARG